MTTAFTGKFSPARRIGRCRGVSAVARLALLSGILLGALATGVALAPSTPSGLESAPNGPLAPTGVLRRWCPTTRATIHQQRARQPRSPSRTIRRSTHSSSRLQRLLIHSRSPMARPSRSIAASPTGPRLPRASSTFRAVTHNFSTPASAGNTAFFNNQDGTTEFRNGSRRWQRHRHQRRPLHRAQLFRRRARFPRLQHRRQRQHRQQEQRLHAVLQFSAPPATRPSSTANNGPVDPTTSGGYFTFGTGAAPARPPSSTTAAVSPTFCK